MAAQAGPPYLGWSGRTAGESTPSPRPGRAGTGRAWRPRPSACTGPGPPAGTCAGCTRAATLGPAARTLNRSVSAVHWTGRGRHNSKWAGFGVGARADTRGGAPSPARGEARCRYLGWRLGVNDVEGLADQVPLVPQKLLGQERFAPRLARHALCRRIQRPRRRR